MKLTFLVGALLAAPVWAQNAVTVRVVDAQKKPIVGAGVEVRLWPKDSKPAAPILTKSNGAAVLSLPSGGDGKPMRASVTVAAKGFAFASVAVTSQSVEVQLKKGATWRSRVVDSAGKPIAGAEISVQAVVKEDDYRSLTFLRNTRAAEKYVAQSGADGRFQIADLPADMDLVFRVTHPRYAAESGQDAPRPSGEIIKMTLGGGLRGRLLDVAGKPLPRTKVYASQPSGGGGWSEDVTDQNGSFTLGSLAAGQYRVGAQLERGAKFVVARVHPVRVVAGKVTAVPVMRAMVGQEIRGVVRDAVTKKPLADAHVSASQGNDSSAYTSTDASGLFTLRVMPGKYQVHMSGAPQGYLRSGMQPTVETSATASNVVFDLKKATVISGLTVDEAGKPVAARLIRGIGQEIKSDAQGRWNFTPLDNEAFTFGGGAADDGYFEVVGPNKWEMPIRSAVVVRVRKKPWSRLSGRAVAPDGTPLAGIRITASFLVPTGDGMSLGDSQSAVSDAQGRFVVSKIRAGNDLKISGQKAGFTPQNSGVITQTGTAWTTSDLVFAALNRRIEGTTTPGARVVAAGREVVADAGGKFRFEGLPSGDIAVFIAKNGQFGSAIAKTEAPLLIFLRPATLQGRDEALAAEFVAEALREPKADKKDIEEWLSEPEGTLGFEAALQKAAQLPAGERSEPIQAAIAAWKSGDSVAALQKGVASLGDGELRAHQLLVAALKTGDAALSRRALEEAKVAFATTETQLYPRESSLYLVAIMAERVSGEAAGFAALDRALAFTIKNHSEKTVVTGAMQTETGRDQVIAERAATVAAGSPALLRRLLEAIEPGSGNDISALAAAIPTVARVHGVAPALLLLGELKRLPAPNLDGARNYDIQDPDCAFGQAAYALIPLLGAQSPVQALELARRVTHERHRAPALATAARFQTGPSAAKAWREAVTAASNDDAPRMAAFAWQNDAKLGAELFQIAHQKAEDDVNEANGGNNLWVPFAFYSARADAALARLILEREWEKSLAKSGIESYQLADFATAMAPLDARRAWEMTRRIPADGDYNWEIGARNRIARYLMMSDAARRTLALNRIGAADTWEPDGATW